MTSLKANWSMYVRILPVSFVFRFDNGVGAEIDTMVGGSRVGLATAFLPKNFL